MSTVPSDPALLQVSVETIGGVSPKKPRRVRKEHERGRLAVEQAVPDDRCLAANVIVWRNWVLELPELWLLRADCRRKMIEFVNHLIRIPNVDPSSRTVMPVWSRMARLLGMHRATIARYFARLASWGALCTVARGRSAKHTPTATGRTENEAGIYAFITPIEPVDISATPDPSPVRSNPMRVYAGEDIPSEQATPALIDRRVAPRHRVQALMASRTAPFWGRHETTNAFDKRGRADARWQAAAELQWLVFPLRHETTAWVAHICKPFFELGWTVADVQHALMFKPDGTTWPHSGADHVRSMRAFIARRLRAWIVDGKITRSHNQRLAAERSRLLARQRAERERAAAEPAATPPSGGWRNLYRTVTGRNW